MQYLFSLGAATKLALLELNSFFPEKKVIQKSKELAIVDLDSDVEARIAMEQLGGIVKISKKQEGQEKLVSKHQWKEWIRRDRNKPYADHKKGMLPPKIARMMVNIAKGQYQILHSKNAKNLLDPFCGTGTVLMEALLLKLNVFGSDIDSNAIAGSQENLDWLKKKYITSNEFKLIKADASKISTQELGEKIQLLVTEPFLGKPKPEFTKLPNIFKGLEKMYLGAFKNWTKILDENAVLVVVFPSCETENKIYSLAHLIDKLERFGYITLSGPVEYARPEAIVKRNIYIFKFKHVKS